MLFLTNLFIFFTLVVVICRILSLETKASDIGYLLLVSAIVAFLTQCSVSYEPAEPEQKVVIHG